MIATISALCALILLVFLLFERTHPSARKLVVLASLCAFVTLGRLIFAFFPLFSPAIGLIMLFAVCTSPLEGFVIGSVSVLCSNFLFGQGTWTVFQMFSYGLAGLISGFLRPLFFGRADTFCLHQRSVRSFIKIILLAALGFFVVMCITGPILDMSGFFFMGTNDISYLKVLILGGIPFNISTAVSTSITIVIFAFPVFFEMNRIDRKL